MTRIAVIDIGTVTARLAISEIVLGRVRLDKKISTIVNLGEGVDHTGVLSSSACERVLACIAGYIDTAKKAGAVYICCTLTSAARDAANSEELLGPLQELGVDPQVIPGEIEGRLTFLGVAQDFPGMRLLVADNGGGSTEIAYGMLGATGLTVELVRSTNVGCRRLTDRFLSVTDPPSATELIEAHTFAASLFGPVVEEMHTLEGWPERLVVTGGTATTLVAVSQGLVPYDSARVHLATISAKTVAELEARFAALRVAERALIPGLQPKRAPVILAGTVAIGELMRAFGFGELTVSESDLLFGMSLVLDAAVRGDVSPVGWAPEFAAL